MLEAISTSCPLCLSLLLLFFPRLSVSNSRRVAVGKMSTIYVLASCLLATDKGINVGSCVRVQRGVWVPVCWTPIRGHQPELLLLFLLLSLSGIVYMTCYNVCYSHTHNRQAALEEVPHISTPPLLLLLFLPLLFLFFSILLALCFVRFDFSFSFHSGVKCNWNAHWNFEYNALTSFFFL